MQLTPADHAMITHRAADTTKSLDAFVTTKVQIETMLERLNTLSDDHIETPRRDQLMTWMAPASVSA